MRIMCSAPIRLAARIATQTDRSITDHGYSLARATAAAAAANHRYRHIGGGEQAGNQVVCRQPWCSDQRAVRQRDAGVLACAPSERRAAAGTGGLIARPTDIAGIIRSEERADNELAGLDVFDILPTSSTMPPYSWPIGVGCLIGQFRGKAKIGAADTGGR